MPAGQRDKKTVLILGGPTASGKSGLALNIARTYNGVIINADSMQLYEGLPLLTAQPSADDFKIASHKLYSFLDGEKPCTAADWRMLVLTEIENALALDQLPIIVGGTGFYIKTLLYGMSPIPDVPHGTRDKVVAWQKEVGNPAFHAELKKRDPLMAEKLHPLNTQRLVRAMEVLEGTGKSLSEWQKIPPVLPPDHLQFIVAVIHPPRDVLYADCNRRLEWMVKNGALDEVRAFSSRKKPDHPLTKALGYQEFIGHLEGRYSLEEALDKARQSTRHYAKRQVTWFRHQIKADIIVKNPTDAFHLPA